MSILTRWLVGCLVAVAVVSGCGGSESRQFTAAEVSDVMTEPVRGTLKAGMTMDALACVEDGDAEHWQCLTDVRDADDRRYSISVEIICDSSSGECISKPYDFIPVP